MGKAGVLMTEIERTALEVMRDNGVEFAEKQWFRHHINEWNLPEEYQKERLDFWRSVKECIKTLSIVIRQDAKAGRFTNKD